MPGDQAAPLDGGTPLDDQIRQWVQRNRGIMIDTLRYLVSLDTQNLAPGGNEHKGQMAVATLLRVLGCEVDVFEPASVPGLLEHPQYWAERPCTGRPNVVGIRRGAGGGRSLLFSGHMDTVPVGPDPWSHDPWGGHISDGRLWGLGSYDMKAGLAASIMVVKALNDLNLRTRGDLLVESVVDEEFGGCNGTLAARLKYSADGAILSEPTNMKVCPAHHGGLMLRTTFRGKTGWGFSPEKPIDPVQALCRYVVALQEWAARRNATAEVPPIYRNGGDALPVLVNQLKAGDVTLPFFADRVPSEAWVTAWIEVYPGTTQEELLEDLRRFYRDAQAKDPVLASFEPEFRPIRWLDGSEIPADHPLVGLLAGSYEAVTGQKAVVEGAPFACDGHMFNLYSSTPMVLMGPTGGQPHAPDEYVDLDDYLRLVEIFIHAAIRWCGVHDG